MMIHIPLKESWTMPCVFKSPDGFLEIQWKSNRNANGIQ